MIEKIKNLIETLEQEINDGYNTLPDYETNNGMTMLGKTTMSLSGSRGSEILTSIITIWILYLIMQ